MDLDLLAVDDLNARERRVHDDDDVAARVDAHVLDLGVDVDDGVAARKHVDLLLHRPLCHVRWGGLVGNLRKGRGARTVKLTG